MARPLPIVARGSGRSESSSSASPPLRLACPRLSPEWQLGAQLALVKPRPYTKEKIAHNSAQQRWPRRARRVIADQFAGTALSMDFPRVGPDRAIVTFAAADSARARRAAKKLSRLLPELWFTLGETSYLRDGVFYQRAGKYKLELVRTTRVRLRRAVRFGFLGDVDDAIAPSRQPAG